MNDLTEQMTIEGPRLLTIREVARALKCSEALVRRWIHRKALAAVRLGEVGIRIKVEDLEKFLSEHPVSGVVAVRDGRRNGKVPGRKRAIVAG